MKRRACACIPTMSPCERAVHRRIPALMRRGWGGRGGGVSAPDLNLYGLQNFSAANHLATSGVGGELGTAAGFGLTLQLYLNALPTGNQIIAHNTSASVNVGWYAQIAAGVLRVYFINGAGANIGTASYTLLASDVGKVFVVSAQHTGSVLRMVNGPVQAGADVAITGYSPATGSTFLGAYTPGTPQVFTSGAVLAFSEWRGTPSVAQLRTYADQARARGDLPETMDGGTVTHRWSAKDELRGVSNPAGRKAYGARAFTTANHYKTANPGGIAGVATGFSVALAVIPERIGGGLQFQIPLNRSPSGNVQQGYQLVLGNFGATAYFECSTGVGTSATTPTTAIADADLGRPLLLVGVHDGAGFLRLYARGEFVGSVAAASYVPYAGAMFVGTRTALDLSVDKASILGMAGGHFVWTPAEIKAMQVELEQTGRMPSVPARTDRLYRFDDSTGPLASVVDTIGGADALGRVGTLELAVLTATAPAAPTQLTDQTTRATADALLRVGSPSVRIIDPTIDGRRTLGAQGLSATNSMDTAGGVVGSASGFWISWYGVLPVASAGFGTLVGKRGVAVPAGYLLGSDGTGLYFEVISGGVSKLLSTPQAVHLGRPKVITGVYTGAELRIYVDGLLYNTLAATGYSVPTAPYRIGNAEGVSAADRACWFGDVGGNFVPTLAQIQQHAADTLERGRMQSIAGLTTTLHDPSLDILASGVDAVPATVLDRVGTDHLTNAGALVVTHAAQKGVRFCLMSPASGNAVALYYQTLASGGVRGQQAGFHISAKLTVTSQATQNNHNLVSTYGPTAVGYNLSLINNNTQIVFTTYNGSTGTSAATYTVPGAKVGVPLIVDAVHTGSQLQLWIDGVQQGADVAVASYTASTVAMCVGVDARLLAVTAAENITVHAVSGGHTVPSGAELLTRATSSISGGSLVQLAGGKSQKHWDLQAAIVGEVVPGRVVDAVASESIVAVGSGLTLAQRTERVWSYETSPILYGANAFTDADYYETAPGVGPAGHAASWWYALPFVCDSQAVSGGTRVVTGRSNSAGWDIRTSGLNSTIGLVASDGGGVFRVAATGSIGASDVGKLLFLVVMWDAAQQKMRTFFKRAEVGTGVAMVGFTPADAGAPFRVGRHTTVAGLSATGIRVLGGMYGVGLPSMPELQAAHDALLAREELIEIPGKTDLLFWLTTDARANGGVLPATVLDRKGAVNLTRVGAPATAPIYARAAA